MSDRPTGYCVVGIGGHARTKLIPAIAANSQELRGLVSRQSPDALPPVPVFPTIDAAIAALPPDTVFLIASPPALHFTQAMKVLAAKRDVIIEKPAFTTANEARLAVETATAQRAVLVEAFMHRHTQLFRQLCDEWRALRIDVTAIDIAFVVPGLPADTFRQLPEVGASVLFDIGCYAVALVGDLGLSLAELTLVDHERPNGTDELLHIAGGCGGLDLAITAGVGAAYENSVTFRRRDGSSLRYAPLFYGRLGERVVTMTAPDGTREERALIDHDGFAAMLATPREAWATDQPQRLREMIAVTACLERLGEELLARRRDG